jgi:hypothetical protein
MPMVGVRGESSGTPVVPVVARSSSPVAAGLLAVVLGLPAGLLAYATAALLFADPLRHTPDTGFLLVSFVGTWALAAAGLGRRAPRLLVVLRRGLLLGAVQWLLLAPLLGRLSAPEVARVADALRVSLHGLPLRLPAASQALLLSCACLLSALLLATLPRGRADEPER